MCGIAGILRQPGEAVAEDDLRHMSRALTHRGPDDEGLHLDENLGLAHRRLAILDLSPAGHQPMCNEDGTVWIVYNGQLYDFEGTRDWLSGRGHRFRSRTDTEVILRLYEERGDDLLADIDGMFAFGLWDRKRRRLLLARDRLGIKPLFYVRTSAGFGFASEMKALLALPWVGKKVHLPGVVQFLYQSSVPGPGSVLDGIQKLPPAHQLTIENGEPRLRRYWQLPDDATDAADTIEAAARGLQGHLSRAARSHLIADVPVGAFLSGGLDSSAVIRAATTRSAAGPVHTFSVRFHDLPSFDEGPAARQVAEACGTTHHELTLGPELVSAVPELLRKADEPFAVSSAFALHHLARFARERVKVVLTGDGGDELLGGYPWRHEPEIGSGSSWHAFFRGLGRSGLRSFRARRSGTNGFLRGFVARLGRSLRPDQRYAELVLTFAPEELETLLAEGIRPVAHETWREHPVRLAYAGVSTADEVNRRLRADLATTLVDEMLTKVDRMTMASGLEARVPFLDRALVEWAFQQPGRLKVRRGVGKLPLRRALASDLPLTASLPKHGFNVPLGEWLRGPLREYLVDSLSVDVVRRRGYFDSRAVDRLVAAHIEGRGDYSAKILPLLALEAWLGENGVK